MKRVLVMILALSLLLAGIPCYAQEESAKVIGEVVSTVAGREIEYRVSVEGNPGICAVRIGLSYDSTVFSAVPNDEDPGFVCEAGTAFSDGIIQCGVDKDKVCNCMVMWNDTKNVTADGVIFSVKLKVSDTAPLGEYPIGISYDKRNTNNKQEEFVKLACVNGSITVRELAPTVSGEVKTVKQGESFDYAVSVADNPGIAGLPLQIIYDSSRFVLVKEGSYYSKPANDFAKGSYECVEASGIVNVLWYHAGNVRAEGTVITLHFTAKEDAPLGTGTINVGCIPLESVVTDVGQTVVFQYLSGSVTVQTSAVVEKAAASAHSITVTVASSPAKQAVVALYQADGKLLKYAMATLSDKGCTVTVQDNNLDFSKLTCKVMLLDVGFAPTAPLFTV